MEEIAIVSRNTRHHFCRSGRLRATLFCCCTNGLNGVVPGGSPKGAATGTAGTVTMVGWCFSLWGIKNTALFVRVYSIG